MANEDTIVIATTTIGADMATTTGIGMIAIMNTVGTTIMVDTTAGTMNTTRHITIAIDASTTDTITSRGTTGMAITGMATTGNIMVTMAGALCRMA